MKTLLLFIIFSFSMHSVFAAQPNAKKKSISKVETTPKIIRSIKAKQLKQNKPQQLPRYQTLNGKKLKLISVFSMEIN